MTEYSASPRRVILSEAKDLKTHSGRKQIFRYAQNDTAGETPHSENNVKLTKSKQMTATTDILQPTPTRGSVKKYSETQPEVAKCHSEYSEDPTGYPRTASEPSETPADPSAKASEPSEMPADPSAAASEHSAALAEPSAGSSGRSAASVGWSNYIVILNAVKNLNTSTVCKQILRYAQDDTMLWAHTQFIKKKTPCLSVSAF